MYFDIPKEQASIIKVVGVGGGGCNAVNHMFLQGIKDVNFVICNTDQQVLDTSPVPNKIQLGPSLTKGRGAGSHPSIGQQATMESLQDIKALLEKNTEMVFITAGMGGGTGTGGAPVIAKLAKEMGILTIGIVTLPFSFEGKKRNSQGLDGLETLKHFVDAILVISNDKLRDMFGNLAWNEAFAKADDILTTAAKGIAEIITVPGYVNVDFEDVKTVLRDSGLAIMGSAVAEGEDRALRAVEQALASPLLNDNDIRGARNILLNITSGTQPVRMDEIAEITEYVQNAAGNESDIIWGNCNDEALGEKLLVTVIATGFETAQQRQERIRQTTRKVTHLDAIDHDGSRRDGTVRQDTEILTEAQEIRSHTKRQGPQDERRSASGVEENDPRQFPIELSLFANSDAKEQEDVEEDFLVTDNADAEQTGQIEEIEQEKDEITFEIKHGETPVDEVQEESGTEEDDADMMSNADKMRVIRNADEDRIKRLKNLSTLKLGNTNYDELEKVPAYKRKQVEFTDFPDSRDSNLSKYTISQDDNGAEVKKNNAFLHDNVD